MQIRIKIGFRYWEVETSKGKGNKRGGRGETEGKGKSRIDKYGSKVFLNGRGKKSWRKEKGTEKREIIDTYCVQVQISCDECDHVYQVYINKIN